MNYMLCRNRVRNFDQWKNVFDSHADAHRAAGLKLVHLWQELDNPRHVFFLFEIEDIARARAFLDSPDATASANESGLIEGDFRFFSRSLAYGPPAEVKSAATAEARETLAPAEVANSSAPAETEKNSAPAEAVKPPEPVKSTEPVKSSTPPEAMKGPERVKSVPPMEPFEGWEPVENWPPAEDTAQSTPQESHNRGRWVRSKY